MIYFGTKERMVWVKAPAINTPLSNAGWSNVGTDLNGGGYAQLSPTGHKEYQFVWGASPAEEIYQILDYRSGAWGAGLIYYLDPFAMKSNALSSAFSFPLSLARAGRMGGTWAESGTAATAQPKGVVLTGASSAVHYLPVPAGHTLHVAYVATANVLTANGVAVTRTAPNVAPLVWTNYTAGVTLKWSGSGTVWGAIAYYTKTGEPATPSKTWTLGKGNSGLRFSGEPQVVGITAVVGGESGLVNASANFIETGLWE